MKNPSSGKAFTEVSVCGHFCQVLGNNCESAGSSYPPACVFLTSDAEGSDSTDDNTETDLSWGSTAVQTQLQNRANSLFHGATEGYARTKFPAPKNQMISPPFMVGQREVLCHPSFAYQVIPSLRTQLKHSSPNNYHLFSLHIHNNYPSGQELGLWPRSAQMCATFLACHVHCLTLGPALRSFHRDRELLPMRDNRSFFQVEMQSQPQWG